MDRYVEGELDGCNSLNTLNSGKPSEDRVIRG